MVPLRYLFRESVRPATFEAAVYPPVIRFGPAIRAMFALALCVFGCARGLASPLPDSGNGDVERLEGGLPADPLFAYKHLESASPHWVMYYAWDSYELTRHVIVDADTGELKAHISTGLIPSVQTSPDGQRMYVVDTFNHGPRRLRKDFLSIYDTTDYSLIDSMELPGNRRALMGPKARTALVGNGRFLILFEFTPQTGVSVVDVREMQIISHVEAPGCMLVYPTGSLSVSMLCGDGRLQTLHFDAEGQFAGREFSKPFFDPDTDPIMENAVAIDGTWYFPSYGGDVYPVDLSGEVPVFHEPWSLADPRAVKEGDRERWLPGSPVHMIASNQLRKELYVLMHPVSMTEGVGDFASPGTEVWVYDAERQTRKRRHVLRSTGASIFVTPDPDPLLLVSAIDPDLYVAAEDGVEKLIPTVEIYDAVTGEYLRRFSDPGLSLAYIMPAPGSERRGSK